MSGGQYTLPAHTLLPGHKNSWFLMDNGGAKKSRAEGNTQKMDMRFS